MAAADGRGSIRAICTMSFDSHHAKGEPKNLRCARIPSEQQSSPPAITATKPACAALSFPIGRPLATLDPTPLDSRCEPRAATIGSTATRSILAIDCWYCCASVSAAEIPSAASGAYVAPDRLCRVVLSRAGQNHVDVDLLCVTDCRRPDVFAHAGFGRRAESALIVRRYAIVRILRPDQGADSFRGSVHRGRAGRVAA